MPDSRDLRRIRPIALILPLLVMALAVPSGTAATAATRVRGPFQLVPGVKLWRIRYPAPYQVRVLRIDPTQATMDVYPAADQFGTITRVSDQAVANGAIAAVNGDFGTFKDRPTHPSLIDAVLRTSGLARGDGFSVSANGRRAWARTPAGSIEATSGGTSFKVWRLNAGAARRKEIVEFTKVGGNLEHPATDMCAARLVPSGGYRWSNATHAGIARTYTVDKQPEPCPYRHLGFGSGTNPGTVILQARRTCGCANRILALSVGDSIDLTWKTKGRPGTTDQVGGQPQLLRNGQNVAPGPNTSGSYFYDRNPRTGIGITRGCTDRDTGTPCYVYLITVDGRRQGWSKGMTLTRFAQEFRNQNPPAYDAFNLDGGGASEMWVSQRSSDYCVMHTAAGGCTVNRPSDGHERAAITSIQVLPGADPGEPDLTGSGAPIVGAVTSAEPVDPVAWARQIAMDPGSTGGLFDAIAQGGLGPAPTGSVFRRTLETYRRAVAAHRVRR
jgi:Phosphodiester glycosidase